MQHLKMVEPVRVAVSVDSTLTAQIWAISSANIFGICSAAEEAAERTTVRCVEQTCVRLFILLSRKHVFGCEKELELTLKVPVPNVTEPVQNGGTSPETVAKSWNRSGNLYTAVHDSVWYETYRPVRTVRNR